MRFDSSTSESDDELVKSVKEFEESIKTSQNSDELNSALTQRDPQDSDELDTVMTQKDSGNIDNLDIALTQRYPKDIDDFDIPSTQPSKPVDDHDDLETTDDLPKNPPLSKKKKRQVRLKVGHFFTNASIFI